jgi:hypothetical protein
MAYEYFAETPHFRPYRWAAVDFQVGLQRINAEDWLHLEDDYDSIMRTKRRHLSQYPERFYKTLPQSRAAQSELRAAIVAHLLEQQAPRFSLSGSTFRCEAGGSWDLSDESVEPLWQLSDFVQEDFMLLQQVDGLTTITAASNAYSSSGRLVSSVGRDIRWAHQPVPSLTALHGARIDRILASVHEDALCARFNWQLTPLSSVFLPPDPHAANKDALRAVSDRLSRDFSLAPSLLHMRVERQTLRRLPETRAIAFSIHTYSDPLACVAADQVAIDALLTLLKGYSAARLHYNEMDTIHASVIAWLESLTAIRR